MGPFFVVSHGNSAHSKHRATPLWKAHVAIAQKGFSLGRQPASPLGQMPLTMRGQASQAIPQTAIFVMTTPG
jgi:hypothetical protein